METPILRHWPTFNFSTWLVQDLLRPFAAEMSYAMTAYGQLGSETVEFSQASSPGLLVMVSTFLIGETFFPWPKIGGRATLPIFLALKFFSDCMVHCKEVPVMPERLMPARVLALIGSDDLWQLDHGARSRRFLA